MTYEHVLSESKVLDETDIGFYGNPDVTFHFNSGRNWVPETSYKINEDGKKVETSTINTTPCPTVDAYEMEDSLEVIVHLPTRNPIIIDWFTVEDEYEEFLKGFITGLEEGYNGIDEVTTFDVSDNAEELGEMIREAIESNTPSSIKIPRIVAD